MKKKSISKDTLVELYINRKMTIKEICQELNILQPVTVAKYMKIHGIVARNTNREMSLVYRLGYTDDQFKCELYDHYIKQLKSKSELAEFYGVSSVIIDRYLKKYKLPIRDHKAANRLNNSADGNHRWKGGKTTSSDGYILIHKLDHPFPVRGNYVYEHRLVVEKELGRYLKHDEHVHHINGKKNDNRPENLQVLTNSEHQILESKIRRQKRFKDQLTLDDVI